MIILYILKFILVANQLQQKHIWFISHKVQQIIEVGEIHPSNFTMVLYGFFLDKILYPQNLHLPFGVATWQYDLS